jgi:hypothetical protein
VYTAPGVGAHVGPPFAGILLDATGGYRGAVAAAGVSGLGAFAALLPLPSGPVRRPASSRPPG